MGGGGGGDNGAMMMMMMLMQQMQAQAEAQRRQIAADNMKRTQGYEDTNLTRYKDLIETQNKKLQEQWDTYNKNLDEVLALDPGFTAGTKYTYNPYAVNTDFVASNAVDDGTETDQKQADDNIKKIDAWYRDLDKRSFEDFNAAKKQVDQSNVWLNAAKQKKDIMGRALPGVPVTSWGGGGQMVSGEAGADSLNNPAANSGVAVGDTTTPDVFSNLSGAVASSLPTTGTGFTSDPASKSQPSALANVMGNAVSSPKKPGAYSMF